MDSSIVRSERNYIAGMDRQHEQDTMPGDDMCLYLLACMYNKHVYVHNKLFYWCTAICKIRCEVDNDLTRDCEIELVFIHPWLFGEVKRICLPKGHTAPDTQGTSKSGKPNSGTSDTGITENAHSTKTINTDTKKCTVPLIQINSATSKSQPSKANNDVPTSTEPSRHMHRKCKITDYSKLFDYDDDNGKDLATPPSLVMRKRPVNLLKKPSRSRPKIEHNRRKNKQNKKSTKDSQSSTSSPPGTSPTNRSDSQSPIAQPKSTAAGESSLPQKDPNNVEPHDDTTQ